jgi:multimeric flavodoxin WrbA
VKVTVLCASPRPDGNSALMAAALRDGAVAANHDVELVELRAVMDGLLRDCRRCRRADGRCSIQDGFADLVHGPPSTISGAAAIRSP